jgi:hypothetical protein
MRLSKKLDPLSRIELFRSEQLASFCNGDKIALLFFAHGVKLRRRQRFLDGCNRAFVRGHKARIPGRQAACHKRRHRIRHFIARFADKARVIVRGYPGYSLQKAPVVTSTLFHSFLRAFLRLGQFWRAYLSLSRIQLDSRQ